ncbi:TolC family protein [Flavobacterium sp.]|uniref:TolC family protein n=1 Tax=Flavobacterium sp. TaxID=239 RepID=UPI0025BB59A2|nr:TolC family protein [Flavobacterium sp.]
MLLRKKNKDLFKWTILLCLFSFNLKAQNNEFTYEEYLGFVKRFHPIAKMADLEISQAQANLLQARGAFDPKIEVDFSRKEYQNKEYYSVFNGSFKIPTWYGIELKAAFENNEGLYLNPQNTVPTNGLTAVGITIPVLQGLVINQRMADLRKAKSQIKLSQAERRLQAVQIMYDASIAYFNWKKNYEEVRLYENYVTNASIRLKGIQTLIEQGDKPAIDSIEAGITLKNRQLNLEESRFKLLKAKLELSNFLWTNNNLPLELEDNLIPEENLEQSIGLTLKTNTLLTENFSVTTHPKINALETKIEMLNIERKLKANMLLPKLDVGYSYISEPVAFSNYRFEDYKFGINAYFPIFLRKERGALKLAQQKIQAQELTLALEKKQLENKVTAQQNEIQTISKQKNIITGLVNDNEKLVQAEERLFSAGESSLFLINTRENNLVSAKLSRINIDNRLYLSHAELFKTIANPE